METYFQVLQIVGGILTPILLGLFIFLLIVIAQDIGTAIHLKREELAEREKFEHASTILFEVPNPTMIGVRAMRSGETLWSGAFYKKDVEELL